MTMKRQRLENGALVRIPLDSETFTVGRVLRPPFVAVYDYRSKEDSVNGEQIVNRPVLFIVAVMDWAVKTGRWRVIGSAPPETAEVRIPDQFIQDRFDPSKCQIIDSSGSSREATIDECDGLEPAAVWEPEHVEQRIRDHFAGRRNVHVESMKLKR
jgi:hypothetical protein